MLCHLSNPHQSTSPWEKKPSTQKWLRVERRNMIHACHATVLGMFHKSNILSLLLVCSPYLPVSQCAVLPYSAYIYLSFFHSNFKWNTPLLRTPCALHHVLRPLFSPACFRHVCVCVTTGWGYSWPCVVCSEVQFSHMPSDQPLALKNDKYSRGGSSHNPTALHDVNF